MSSGRKSKPTSPYAKYNKVPYHYPFPTGAAYANQRMKEMLTNDKNNHSVPPAAVPGDSDEPEREAIKRSRVARYERRHMVDAKSD